MCRIKLHRFLRITASSSSSGSPSSWGAKSIFLLHLLNSLRPCTNSSMSSSPRQLPSSLVEAYLPPSTQFDPKLVHQEAERSVKCLGRRMAMAQTRCMRGQLCLCIVEIKPPASGWGGEGLAPRADRDGCFLELRWKSRNVQPRRRTMRSVKPDSESRY